MSTSLPHSFHRLCDFCGLYLLRWVRPHTWFVINLLAFLSLCFVCWIDWLHCLTPLSAVLKINDGCNCLFHGSLNCAFWEKNGRGLFVNGCKKEREMTHVHQISWNNAAGKSWHGHFRTRTTRLGRFPHKFPREANLKCINAYNERHKKTSAEPNTWKTAWCGGNFVCPDGTVPIFHTRKCVCKMSTIISKNAWLKLHPVAGTVTTPPCEFTQLQLLCIFFENACVK